jgi:hypothetical protein
MRMVYFERRLLARIAVGDRSRDYNRFGDSLDALARRHVSFNATTCSVARGADSNEIEFGLMTLLSQVAAAIILPWLARESSLALAR